MEGGNEKPLSIENFCPLWPLSRPPCFGLGSERGRERAQDDDRSPLLVKTTPMELGTLEFGSRLAPRIAIKSRAR